MDDTKLHVFNTVVWLADLEVPGHRCGSSRIGFITKDTRSVFINSISERSTGFPHILLVTLFAINDVNQIRKFTSYESFLRKGITGELPPIGMASECFYSVEKWTVCTLSQSSTKFWFRAFNNIVNR